MKKVWINGCFDILHRGHIPVNNQEDRKFFLESIEFIDQVVIFNTENELIQKIATIKPEVMIVGSDYKNKRVVGSENAGLLVFFDRIGNYSTTNILEKK